jgi:Fungal pheromone mating factor STE2 GPCR
VPIYNRGNPGVKQDISWADIDDWSAGVANVWVTTGTCFGLCLAVLAYLIALTPNKKNGTPFHTSLMLALIFEMARLLCDIGRAADVGLSPYSAYLGLTNDFGATTYSMSFQAIEVVGMVCATLASIFTFACLYLQAAGLLTSVHNRHRALYLGIICYLLSTSVVALAFRITITVIQAMYTSGRYESFSLDTYRILRRTTSIAYAVSIGSWCCVSLVSVSWLMFTRSKLIVSNRPYDTALTLLSLVFMESMVIPSMFACQLPSRSHTH